MCRYLVALAALFVACLILPIPIASAQVAPGDTEMPTGDVWPSREERIYIPQKALMPNRVDDETNAPASGDEAAPNAKKTPSRDTSCASPG